ncbi:D-2-hydroxyacid dehydrogenase [Falsiroseomonas sp. E2-1-a20]|uniref:D-2-hydroxyacid dehydrogenase n=1 Tax=Falsiroseomonas sp. E2-1-a20 TaxID=3239300 RepID=UPI003F356CE2
MKVLVFGEGVDLALEDLAAAAPGYDYVLATDEAATLREAAEAEIIIGLAHVIPGRVLAAAPRLRWIQALTTGTDQLEALPELRPEVVVTAMRGIQGPQMAELTFLLMLSLLRDIRGTLERQAARIWDRRPQKLLHGRTVTILGVGSIAEHLAERCRLFGMRVIGVSAGRQEAPHFDRILPREVLADAAAQADFLVVLVPFSATTRHIVDAGVLAAMRPDAFLVNIARGAVVDEAALLACLAERRIAGAGLDVFAVEPLPADNPLWGLPNVIITPHVGGVSDIYMQQALPALVANLRGWQAEGQAGLRNLTRAAAVGA